MNWEAKYKAELDQLTVADEFKDELVDLATQANTAKFKHSTTEKSILFETSKKTGVKQSALRLFKNAKKYWQPLSVVAAGLALCVYIGTNNEVLFGNNFQYGAASSSTAIMQIEPNTAGELSGMLTQESETFDMANGQISTEDFSMRTINAKSQHNSIEPKLIYDAEIVLESLEHEKTLGEITSKVDEFGGYMQSNQTTAFGNEKSQSSLTYRIPAEKYSVFVEEVSTMANLVRKSEEVKDVTTQYIDISTRIASLENQYESLLSLQEKAVKLADLIEISDKLSEVQSSIESYYSNLNYLSAQVEYSTVHIQVRGVTSLTKKPETFAEKIANAFAVGFENFTGNIANAILWLISNIIWIATIIIGIFVFIAMIKNKKKKADKN